MNFEQLATEVRSTLGFSEIERPNLLDLLVMLRVKGIIDDFGPDEENVLGDVAAHWDKETKSILIAKYIWDNLETSEDGEVRFTIYHEIGHAVLNHPSRNRKTDGRPQFGRDIERHELEADDFALAFAIPMNLAHRKLDDIDFLVRRFGLTKLMTGRRMSSLQKGTRPSSTVPWSRLSNAVVDTEDDDWNF